MAKYHVNNKGEPAICRAQHNCPLGGEGDHIETNNIQEARAFAETKVAEEADGTFNTLTSGPTQKTVGSSTPVVFGINGNINEDYNYPQANDIEKLSTVVDAIESNVNTTSGLGEAIRDDTTRTTNSDHIRRQGDYYASAAGYLGLVEHSGGDGPYSAKEFRLTNLGQEFVNADEEDRVQILREAVNNMPAMQEYRAAGGGEDGQEAAMEHMLSNKVVSEGTVERPAATLATWDKKLNDTAFVNTMSKEKAGSSARISRAIEIDEQKRAERKEREEEQRKQEEQAAGAQRNDEFTCQSCYLIRHASQNNGNNICTDCE